MGEVYVITDRTNGKQYVGMTRLNAARSLASHFEYAEKAKLITPFTRAIRIHGKENFTIEILFSSADVNLLHEREVYFIDHFDTLYPNGYNTTKNDGTNAAKKPWKHSESAKKKISIANKGRRWSLAEETKKRQGEAKLGNQFSKGIKRSAETKRRMSESKKGKSTFSNNPELTASKKREKFRIKALSEVYRRITIGEIEIAQRIADKWNIQLTELL